MTAINKRTRTLFFFLNSQTFQRALSVCTQSGKPTFSGQYSVELGVQYALASQSVVNDKHLPLFSSSGSLFASLFIFSLSSDIKNTIFWEKKHKFWILIGFNDCAVGRVGTMICFHRCVTRFRIRRLGGDGWGWGGYVLLSPSTGHSLSRTETFHS